jgi:hypothetical protein
VNAEQVAKAANQESASHRVPTATSRESTRTADVDLRTATPSNDEQRLTPWIIDGPQNTCLTDTSVRRDKIEAHAIS